MNRYFVHANYPAGRILTKYFLASSPEEAAEMCRECYGRDLCINFVTILD